MLGVGRAQELPRLDESRFAVLLALPAQPRVREPAGSWRERAGRDPEEEGGQSSMDFVGVHATRHVQQDCDVLSATA